MNCPRCGFEVHYLVKTCYESRWNKDGGLCSDCCAKAAKYFDKKGWPDHPHQRGWPTDNDASE